MRVGICLPIGERGPERRAKGYREMRELAIAADQNGADSIWVADHLFYENDDRGVVGIWGVLAVPFTNAEAGTLFVRRGPSLTVAVIQNGTLPSQKEVVGTVSTIADLVREEDLGSPGIIIAGDVVRFAEVGKSIAATAENAL